MATRETGWRGEGSRRAWGRGREISLIEQHAASCRRHAFANSDYKLLWSALEGASKQPVGEWMRTWTLKEGFPLVTLKVGGSHVSLLCLQRARGG
jgi:hypothetical protein